MWQEYTFEISLIAIWFLLLIIKRARTKRGDLELLLWFAVFLAYGLFEILELAIIPALILRYSLYGGLLITLIFFNVKGLFKRDHTYEELKRLKKDYKELVSRSEVLRHRFMTTIDILKDGLSFRNDDGSTFGTEQYCSITGLKESEFTYNDFLKHMHPDDVASYETALKKCSKKHPVYETRYRFKKENGYTWIKERGSKLEAEGRMMTITLVEGIDVLKYPKTEVDVLNMLPVDKALFEHLQELARMRKPYSLVFIELKNIPAINERYGRDVGDLMMGEFLTKLKYNFLKDAHSLFRVTGIRFAMILSDRRKYEVLERALKHGGDLLNFSMQFGGVKQSVYPYFGIQHIEVFEEPVDEIVSRTQKALKIALDDKTQENYFIIR